MEEPTKHLGQIIVEINNSRDVEWHLENSFKDVGPYSWEKGIIWTIIHSWDLDFPKVTHLTFQKNYIDSEFLRPSETSERLWADACPTR